MKGTVGLVIGALIGTAFALLVVSLFRSQLDFSCM